MAVRWKLCGVMDERTAEVAAQAGVDAVGFVFYPPSPRAVTPEQAARISAVLPEETWRFGVFVDEPRASIEATITAAGLDFVQLSGDERPQAADGLSRHAFKAIRLGREATPATARAAAADYPQCTLLVDAAVRGQYGGTGAAANWEAAAALAREHRLMLAGGLTAANVAVAIRTVKPWAIDVSSGVEDAPGHKSPELIREFADALEEFR